MKLRKLRNKEYLRSKTKIEEIQELWENPVYVIRFRVIYGSQNEVHFYQDNSNSSTKNKIHSYEKNTICECSLIQKLKITLTLQQKDELGMNFYNPT